jgi:hypothetical protein
MMVCFVFFLSTSDWVARLVLHFLVGVTFNLARFVDNQDRPFVFWPRFGVPSNNVLYPRRNTLLVMMFWWSIYLSP